MSIEKRKKTKDRRDFLVMAERDFSHLFLPYRKQHQQTDIISLMVALHQI